MKKTWRDYFFEIAEVVAKRSTCNRANVGAILVKDKRIVATGYNGSLPGAPHCLDVGCDVVDNHCIRCIHAEINAIAWSARYGVPTEDTTMFITHYPCFPCFKAVVSAGISMIYYNHIYNPDPKMEEYFPVIRCNHYPAEKLIYIKRKTEYV